MSSETASSRLHDIDEHHHRCEQEEDAVLKPGHDIGCRELAGHDPGEEAEDDCDPEHVMHVAGDVDGRVEFLE